jgi:outer membrane protein TolC
MNKITYLIISMIFAITAHAKVPKFTVALPVQDASVLTIDQAVKQALAHRPDLEALTYATQANKELSKSAAAGYYPTVTLNGSITPIMEHQGDPSYNMNITANQLLYSPNGPQLQYKKAKKVAEVSKLDEEIQSNTIRLAVEKAFLQAWLLQEQKKTIQSLTKSAKTAFSKAEHENKLQLSDKNVWLKSAEDYASSISTIDQYKDSITNAYKRLEFLTGQALHLGSPLKDGDCTKLQWKHKKQIVLKPLQEYYTLATKNRPEITQGTKKIAIESYNLKIAERTNLPSFSANAQAGVTRSPVIPNAKYDWTYTYHNVNAVVTWPIFSGLVSDYQERQAAANKIKEMLNQEQTVLNIKQEVQDRYYALSRTLTKAQAQKINYLRTHNDYKRSKQEFEIGQASPVDLETAKTTWEQAQLDWNSVNIEVAYAMADLMYACGYAEELE